MPGFVQTKGRGWVGEGTGAQQNRFRSAFHMFALFFFCAEISIRGPIISISLKRGVFFLMELLCHVYRLLIC